MKTLIRVGMKNTNRHFKKEIVWICVCAIFLFQAGCFKDPLIPGADYLLITDQELATLNADETLELSGKERRDVQDQNLFYFTNMFFEDDEFYYGKTCISKNRSVYLEKISKDPVQVTRKKYNYGDTDCMAFNGTQLLTTVNRYRELLICSFDTDLNLVNEQSVEWIEQQDVEGFMCWEIQPKDDGWIFLIAIHPAGTDTMYNENHLLFLDSAFQVQMDYDLGFCDGSYSSFVLKENNVFLNRYAQGKTDSFEPAYSNVIDVFNLDSGMITASYELPYTTNGRFVQNGPDDLLILDRSMARSDRQIPIVLFWPETGEIVPVSIDFEYPYASGPAPFISIDQDRIYLSYRSVI